MKLAGIHLDDFFFKTIQTPIPASLP